MHTTCVGKCLKGARDGEIAVDVELRGVCTTGFDDSGGERTRGATLIDAATLNGACTRSVIESQCRLSPKYCHRWTEFHADRSAPQTVRLIRQEGRTRDTRGN